MTGSGWPSARRAPASRAAPEPAQPRRGPREPPEPEPGEGQLQAQDDLAEYDERAGSPVAVNRKDDDGRNDRDETRDEPPQPRPDADAEEAFHHDLTGQCPGERRVLPREQQGGCEQHTGRRRAEQGRQQLEGVTD